MIYNCGLTAEEAWKREKVRREQWHPFFALWPRVVAVDESGMQSCAWLQYIERKGVYHEPTPMLMVMGEGPYWSWEFRLPSRAGDPHNAD